MVAKVKGRRTANGKRSASVRVKAETSDVLTLAEAAAYLRLPELEVITLVDREGLPGRRVGMEWRFFTGAIQRWLSEPRGSTKEFWDTQLGALKDDPYLEEIVQNIYALRGRSETEES